MVALVVIACLVWLFLPTRYEGCVYYRVDDDGPS